MVKGEQDDLAAGLWLECREGCSSCRVEQRKLAIITGTWAQDAEQFSSPGQKCRFKQNGRNMEILLNLEDMCFQGCMTFRT